jgi:hypothetical protein
LGSIQKTKEPCDKIEKNSIKTYFFERTAGGPKSSTFYPIIKPFLSNKGMKSNNSIILCEKFTSSSAIWFSKFTDCRSFKKNS